MDQTTYTQTNQQTDALLQSVSTRLRWASLFESAAWFLFLFAIGYYILLMVSRFTGVLPELFSFWTVCLVPVAAIIAAVIRHRHPTTALAARQVDASVGTKDLFLTASSLSTAPGEFQPLVTTDAAKKAGGVDAKEVVPFQFTHRSRLGLGYFAAVIIAALLMPQFDPFGAVAVVEAAEKQKEELAKSRKATSLRAKQLKKDKQEKEELDPVDEEVEKLKMSLQKAQPTAKQDNKMELAKRQKDLGKKYRQIQSTALKNFLKKQLDSQGRLSAFNKDQKIEEWTKQLQEGKTEAFDKQIDEVMKNMEALASAKDPVKQKELQRKVKQQLSDLRKFAKENAGSKELTAAIERAMKQMEAAKSDPQMAKEAMKAAQESMELAKMEMEQLANDAEKMAALEDALKLVQMAKQLNEEGKLDGGECEKCVSMEDYMELYAQMMGGMNGEGEGEGLGGPGIGEGGEAPEDDSVVTNFKKEKESPQIGAGKMLMSLKTKGMGKKGDVVKEYRKNLAAVKQGVSEAIEREQIPPGYHKGIKGYFDTLNTPKENSESKE